MYKKLEIIYIVPSRYDDDGYVQRWIKGVVPSNSLAVLKALTKRIIDRTAVPAASSVPANTGSDSIAENFTETLWNTLAFEVQQEFPLETLPPEVSIRMTSYDDNVEKIPFKKITALNKKKDTKVLVGIVGVQSNQFPRASDIALKFRKLGIDVMVGGFHVTGVLSLFNELTPELKQLAESGVTLIAGEAETAGVLENVFADFLNGKPKLIYRFPKAPDISEAPLPQAEPRYIDHFGAHWATLDSSRGCPFGCTFCTVINIQGRKMRCRKADGVIETVRSNYEKGVHNFFFTDDNFARSANWEAIFDGLIAMQDEGKKIGFMMQIDTQAAKIPHFVEKAKKAGCRTVFIGMESVNPANIQGAGKTQNKVEQYREMVKCWQDNGVVVHVGYIIGFPNDTLESVRSDVVFLRDHVGVDLVSFFMMTPLPGSVDHKNMIQNGVLLDPDLNKYDSFHETFKHPKMAEGEWKEAAQLAYREFYTKEHCTDILKRLPKEHYWLMFWNLIWYRYSGVFSGTHPMMTGFFRQKDRLDRRPGLPVEGRLRFAWRWLKDFVLDSRSYIKLFFEFREIWFSTRPQAEKRERILPSLPKYSIYSPLASLRTNWNSLQQKVAEHCWRGSYEDAKRELAVMLSATAEKLRQAKQSIASKMGRRKTKLDTNIEIVVQDIENCLNELEKAPSNPSILFKTEEFVREHILPKYEELTSCCVRIRRKANNWRDSAVECLEQGRIFQSCLKLARRPWMAFVESYLSFRFFIACFRKEQV